MRKVKSGGGLAALLYSLKKAGEVGGVWNLYKALRTRNACKTCALGMGGQKGGMVNERGSFPEVCKKSIQAMTADMQPAITADFWSTNSIADLATWSPRRLEKSGRLIQPVLYERGATHYRTITWSEAFDRLVKALKNVTPDESFWYFSGRSSNEAGFLLQLLARLYGTNNVNNCSYYCHQASGVGLNSALGTGTATITLDDLEHADLVMIIGGNPPSNHPRLMTTLMHLRRRGGKVITVNPIRELGMENFRIPSDPWSFLFGTKITTQFVQPHIGGDLALLTGVAKSVLEKGKADLDFLHSYCRDSVAYLESLEKADWDTIVRYSGVEKSEIEAIADTYCESKNTVFGWTMGITHHQNGVENVQAIINLALLRGMVGRAGAGLMPIRGHSNVQGIGSVGVTPKLKDSIFKNLQDKFGVKLPTTPGMDTMACMEAAESGQAKVAVCLGGNLFGSNPDATYADSALSKLQMLVMLNTTMNTGHVHGLAAETIILPVLARDEEPEPTTQESMFNYVRLSDGGPRRVPGPRSEIQVVAELGKRLLGDTSVIKWDDMEKAETIRQWISKVVPGYDEISRIGETKKEFYISGRVFHEPKFATPDGKAVLFSHQLRPIPGSGVGEVRLMTARSEGQFNTVVYEEEDLYRGQERRDLILLHPDDFPRLGLQPEQLVTIQSEVGVMVNQIARPYQRIRAGNALMYYPEANVLVPRHLDPQSKTPAFKSVIVTLRGQSGWVEPSSVVHYRAGDVPEELQTAGDSRKAMRTC
jgi:molybdopterin-dependent oxidoreductase alpha subunit